VRVTVANSWQAGKSQFHYFLSFLLFKGSVIVLRNSNRFFLSHIRIGIIHMWCTKLSKYTATYIFVYSEFKKIYWATVFAIFISPWPALMKLQPLQINFVFTKNSTILTKRLPFYSSLNDIYIYNLNVSDRVDVPHQQATKSVLVFRGSGMSQDPSVLQSWVWVQSETIASYLFICLSMYLITYVVQFQSF